MHSITLWRRDYLAATSPAREGKFIYLLHIFSISFIISTAAQSTRERIRDVRMRSGAKRKYWLRVIVDKLFPSYYPKHIDKADRRISLGKEG